MTIIAVIPRLHETSSLHAGIIPTGAAWGRYPQPHTLTAAHPVPWEGGEKRRCLKCEVSRAASVSTVLPRADPGKERAISGISQSLQETGGRSGGGKLGQTHCHCPLRCGNWLLWVGRQAGKGVRWDGRAKLRERAFPQLTADTTGPAPQEGAAGARGSGSQKKLAGSCVGPASSARGRLQAAPSCLPKVEEKSLHPFLKSTARVANPNVWTKCKCIVTSCTENQNKEQGAYVSFRENVLYLAGRTKRVAFKC